LQRAGSRGSIARKSPRGRNNFRLLFDETMSRTGRGHGLKLVNELGRANDIPLADLNCHYQPIVGCQDLPGLAASRPPCCDGGTRVEGASCCLKSFNSACRGKTGLIDAVGAWVFAGGLCMPGPPAWPGEHIKLAVNLSALQFSGPGKLFDVIKACAGRFGIASGKARIGNYRVRIHARIRRSTP